jgi:hypothetical protein
MSPSLFKMLLGAAVRHGLTILSTYLVSHQLLDPTYTNTFVENVTTYILEAAPAIIALVWSGVQKARAHDKATQPPVYKFWL